MSPHAVDGGIADDGGPLLSVALCTYNGARFIEEQVRSICAQTLTPDEIVLSDDASRDDCVTLARHAHAACAAQLTQGDARPRLRVLQNHVALGVTRNFEQAARACEGEFIALCDQDDIWDPEKLERLVAALRGGRQPSLVHADARLVDSQGRPLGSTLFGSLGVSQTELELVHGGQAFDVLLRRNLVTGATTVLRRSLLEHALPFPPEWLHDEWLGLIAAALGGLDIVEWCSIDYRQHGTNQVGAQRMGLIERVRKALAPRGDDARRRSAKARILLERLQAMGELVPGALLEKARMKLAHQQNRAALPRFRAARLRPIAKELASGQYARYDYGVQGAIRDLLAAP
ncbi:glycosyltransferase family 2 protein [Variovorax sp. LARHSF232]